MSVSLKVSTIFAVFVSLLFVLTAEAAVPSKVSYQGKLTDTSGNPVADDTYTMSFYIFSALTGGSQLWAESQSVDVADGIYSVELGTNVALTSTVFNSGATWLEVRVWNGSAYETLTPRQHILASAYALKSGDADTLGGSASSAFATSSHNHDSAYVNENQANSITSAMIADGALTAADLGANSVGASEIATNAVGAAEIATGAVASSEILNGSVTATDLADGATLAEILDDDGPGSGLNADYLDGYSSSAFVNVGGDTMTGRLTLDPTDDAYSLLATNYRSGAAYGLYSSAQSSGSTTYGAYIYADGATSNNGTVYGIYSNNHAETGTSANLYGLYNYSYHYGTSGATYGIRGYAYGSDSGNTYGVFGFADHGNQNFGGYFGADGTGLYAYSNSSSNHAGHFTTSVGAGLAGASLYARSYNSGAGGIALWAHNDHTTSTDATLVVSNDGSGPLVKGFGGDGGEDEFRFDNDGSLKIFGVNGISSPAVLVDAEEDSNGPAIKLRNSAGAITIELDGGYAGPDGRIITDELQITGGSDLSENFDILDKEVSILPGMVMSINPEQPGHLQISKEAYDNKVAGIVSGAGGIKTGMLMGQRGTEADGQYPVALTGRVYCLANTSAGAIKPGDLLTTSEMPGHAMKVIDHSKANGAILGKAMTSLDDETGMVLVLVSLQ